MTTRTILPRLVCAVAATAMAGLFFAGVDATAGRFSSAPPRLVVAARGPGLVDVRSEGSSLATLTLAARGGGVTVERCAQPWNDGRCRSGAVRRPAGSLGPLPTGETAHLLLRGSARGYTFGGSA